LTYDFSFKSKSAVVMTNTRAKTQGQRSIGSKDRVKTNGRTDTTDRITFPASAVSKNCLKQFTWNWTDEGRLQLLKIVLFSPSKTLPPIAVIVGSS